MHAVRRTLLAAVPFVLLLDGALAHSEPPPPAPAKAPEAAKPAEPPPAEKKEATPASPTPSSPGNLARFPDPPAGRLMIALDGGKSVACREQQAQSFLIRGNWFPNTKDADKVKEARKLMEESFKYRTEKYGYFEGFGNPKGNAHPPKHYAKATTFMGMSAQVHEKIITPLKCVEAALKASGASNEYKPRAMGGMRFHNTYKGAEVSNHVYGIAIDIEPDRNTCCGCVAPWNEHPLCKQKGKTVWERMVMPKSWVETFEKYGFYWLGHDVLQDTMHFEFLGDPDKVTE